MNPTPAPQTLRSMRAETVVFLLISVSPMDTAWHTLIIQKEFVPWHLTITATSTSSITLQIQNIKREACFHQRSLLVTTSPPPPKSLSSVVWQQREHLFSRLSVIWYDVYLPGILSPTLVCMLSEGNGRDFSLFNSAQSRCPVHRGAITVE